MRPSLVRATPCSKCGAQAGERCRTPAGTIRTHYHAARRDLARVLATVAAGIIIVDMVTNPEVTVAEMQRVGGAISGSLLAAMGEQ